MNLYRKFESTWFGQKIFIPVVAVILTPIWITIALVCAIIQAFKKDGGV